MKFICSLVTVDDMDRSRKFYEKVLRQEVKYDFGENVTFKGDFAIHLKSHFAQLLEGKEITQGGNNFELYFEYDDVDSFASELRSNNVEFVHDVKEQPWRQKVVRFYDPDNNIIEVGESLEYLSFRLTKEGKSVEEIASITTMPVEFVKASILKYE
jgi:catechol 2,3-dioxygenase-like lactoylglutathione lyase family enzyme